MVWAVVRDELIHPGQRHLELIRPDVDDEAPDGGDVPSGDHD